MYAVLSFSHKNLEIALREKIALPQEELEDFYQALFVAFPQIKECILLSTCNRFELLLFMQEDSKSQAMQIQAMQIQDSKSQAPQSQILRSIVAFIASYRNVALDLIEKSAQSFYSQEAVRHIFSVASSLDSLVVGETQITGQLKSAYKHSYELGFCKKELTRVIHFASKTAALIRSQTQISKNPTSISSVAVSHFFKLGVKKARVIVVGTGEIGKLCVKYLLSHDFEVLLLSRTFSNAQAFRDELADDRLSIAPFSQLPKLINIYPYLFCATGAPHAIITQEMIKDCDFQRVWFDLALPRDIEVLETKAIRLFVIDDLQEMVLSNKGKREEEVKKAEEIISKQIIEFYQWLQSLEVEPIIKAFRDKAKRCCVDEVSRAIKKGFLDPQEEEGVLKILHNAFNKFLHHPTLYIKTIKEEPKSDFILENIKKLFDLSGEEAFKNPHQCDMLDRDKKEIKEQK